MRNLVLVLLFACLIYGCSNDDNPVNSTNQGKTWNLIYSKSDSTAYLDTAYHQKIAYVLAEYGSKCWVKFEYKSNGSFKFDTKMRNGQYVNTMSGYSSDKWLTLDDSSKYEYANSDTLYCDVIPSHTHFVSIKNLEVYFK